MRLFDPNNTDGYGLGFDPNNQEGIGDPATSSPYTLNNITFGALVRAAGFQFTNPTSAGFCKSDTDGNIVPGQTIGEADIAGLTTDLAAIQLSADAAQTTANTAYSLALTKAPINNPTFTGLATIPNQAAGTVFGASTSTVPNLTLTSGATVMSPTSGMLWWDGTALNFRTASTTVNLLAAGTGGGTGTVTSVGLSLPSIFTVTVSPITTSGTLTATLATQSANTIFAGPASGSAAAPTFRALVAADIPNINENPFNVTVRIGQPYGGGGDISGEIACLGATRSYSLMRVRVTVSQPSTTVGFSFKIEIHNTGNATFAAALSATFTLATGVSDVVFTSPTSGTPFSSMIMSNASSLTRFRINAITVPTDLNGVTIEAEWG